MPKKNAKVTDITTRMEWDCDVVNCDELAVVVFYSKESKPSIEMVNRINDVACEVKNGARFFSVDIDRHPNIIWNFRVSIIPTVMFFQQGQKLYENITLKDASVIQEAIEPYLAAA